MSQNALDQSDCRVLKSIRSLDQHGKNVWFLISWYKFIEIKSWLKIINGLKSETLNRETCGCRTRKYVAKSHGVIN